MKYAKVLEIEVSHLRDVKDLDSVYCADVVYRKLKHGIEVLKNRYGKTGVMSKDEFDGVLLAANEKLSGALKKGEPNV